MKSRKITIGNQDIEFSGYIFTAWFGILLYVTIFFVLIATIKYIFWV